MTCRQPGWIYKDVHTLYNNFFFKEAQTVQQLLESITLCVLGKSKEIPQMCHLQSVKAFPLEEYWHRHWELFIHRTQCPGNWQNYIKSILHCNANIISWGCWTIHLSYVFSSMCSKPTTRNAGNPESGSLITAINVQWDSVSIPISLHKWRLTGLRILNISSGTP